MLFISDNKKIDSVVNKLQPSLKLKINIERDFDCGLNDVFEKRPDVVFIQNQIAGVSGESVARHIQMLLGGMAPKFILIHSGDAKAKPIKGLYDHLVDLSQSEANIAGDILIKLNQVLGPRWQTIFSTAVQPGGESASRTTSPQAPGEIFPPFTLDDLPDLPAVETRVPHSTASLPGEDLPAADFSLDLQRAEMLSEEYQALEKEKTAITSYDTTRAGEILSSPTAVVPAGDHEQYAADLSTALAEITRLSPEVPPARVEKPATPPENTPAAEDVAPPLPGYSTLVAAAPPHVPQGVPPDRENGAAEVPLPGAQEAMPWTFDGEPRLAKKSWKWYQFVELLLVFCLLVGGWYFITQKPQPVKSAAIPAGSTLSQAAGEKVPKEPPSLKSSTPSFIPLVGLDPAFAVENPGWQRYVGQEFEFRLFYDQGTFKALQVKAEKGNVISDTFLKEILLELTGTAEYRETSREDKFGLQLSHGVVQGKAELLIYRKNTAIQAVVVSLN